MAAPSLRGFSWQGPATQPQLSFIKGLAVQSGTPNRHLDSTRRRRQCHRHRSFAARAGPAASGAADSASSVAELKAQLLQAVSRSNNPQPGDNPLQLEEAVEAVAAQLAACTPHPDAALSPLLLGSWALLFSGKSRRLAAAAFSGSAAAPAAGALSLQQALQSASDATYRTFYQYVPVLAGSAVGRRSAGSAASNVQVLRDDSSSGQRRVDNVVETKGTLPLRLCVSGTVDVVQPSDTAAPCSCVAVRFDRFDAQLGGLPKVELSLGWLRPLGLVDTLYLDDDLRVSVGDKGGLFVLRRLDRQAES